MQTLQQWAMDNYDTIGIIVVTLGNAALTVGTLGLDLATPLLQELVNNH
ncbi:hypothetical protein [Nocardia sp. NPDC024068]